MNTQLKKDLETLGDKKRIAEEERDRLLRDLNQLQDQVRLRSRDPSLGHNQAKSCVGCGIVSAGERERFTSPSTQCAFVSNSG